MLENKEFAQPRLTPQDAGLLQVLESVDGRSMAEIDSYAHFELVEFEDYSHARAPFFKPRDYNFHFKAQGPDEIPDTFGPYRTHQEAGHALMAAFFCTARVRNVLIASLQVNEPTTEIKIPSSPEEIDELVTVTSQEDPDSKFVKNGIAIARSHLFGELVPEDERICKTHIGTYDDGSQIQIQMYRTVLDGVSWQVITDGEKMGEFLRINRPKGSLGQ